MFLLYYFAYWTYSLSRNINDKYISIIQIMENTKRKKRDNALFFGGVFSMLCAMFFTSNKEVFYLLIVLSITLFIIALWNKLIKYSTK